MKRMWFVSAYFKGNPPNDVSIPLSGKSDAEKEANNGFSENKEL